MRITVYTDYALRLLMYLALRNDRLATIAEIAAAYGISKNHLMKVAYQLTGAGYVLSVRGRGGGLRLAKPVEAITLGEVVRKTEPDMSFVHCMELGELSCRLSSACVLRRAMKTAGDAFVDTLDGYTLGDLVQPGTKLRALLTVPGTVRDMTPRHSRSRRPDALRVARSPETTAAPRKAGKRRAMAAAGTFA